MSNAFSCANTCKLSKATSILVGVFLADYDYKATEQFECGNCNNKDLWYASEMLWDNEREFLVTPCCHCEAAHALYPDERYTLDQHREDYEDYIFSVTGR